ncbi:MAG: hypothetical protein CBB71_01815 [Rhodopirellula sp. TMED11]|nr:MAG: hypothetical protein CBB71_01815 [Rhodopirellula sp. TMED11]
MTPVEIEKAGPFAGFFNGLSHGARVSTKGRQAGSQTGCGEGVCSLMCLSEHALAEHALAEHALAEHALAEQDPAWRESIWMI